MKLAFIVIDLQKGWRGQKNAASMDSARDTINAILPAFRKKGLPVVWVQPVDEGDGVVEGSSGFEMIEGLEPLPGEARVSKRRGNSFAKTELDGLLRAQGVDTLVLAGYCAEWCVLSTYRGALDLDYLPFLLEAGTASGDEGNHGFVKRICDVIPFELLKKMLSD